MSSDTRRRLGAYYTPAGVADWIVARVGAHGRVWDPGVGEGAFLLAVLRATPPGDRRLVAATQLFGYDVDAEAVATCRARIAEAAGLDLAGRAALARHVLVRDTLHQPPEEGFDVAVGNPPFLTRLRNLTAIEPALAARLKARHRGALGPYTDTAAIFALEMLRAANRVGAVLPASTFAARDAKGLRATAGVVHAWCLPEFPDVGVPCVATVFGTGPTQRWIGDPPVELDRVSGEAESWAPLLYHPDEPPSFTLHSSGILADIAEATADFRDEFYALRGQVTEDEGAPDTVRLVTSGLVDLGATGWGRRRAKLHGSSFQRPVAPVRALHPRQFRQRAPKLLVATQTAVMEGFADPHGHYVGMTPVISVYPRSVSLHELAVAALSPIATAWALSTWRGTGLTLDTIKLSASQLLRLPLPRASLRPAAEAFARGEPPAVWGAAAADAYGAPAAVVAWWLRRISRRRRESAGAT